MKRPRWAGDTKRAVAAAAIAIAALVAKDPVDELVGYLFKGATANAALNAGIVKYAGALLFIAAAVVTVRSLGDIAVRRTQERIGFSHAGMLRVGISLLGYPFVAITVLGQLGVNIAQLLVGGALTGVVLGIACQQSLGNLFAGLVLLVSRPFSIGDSVIVHSGALGGPHKGLVLETGLVYVVLETDDGVLRLPNSALLNSGVGPRPAEPEPSAEV